MNYLLLELELRMIKHFLDNVCQGCGQEIEQIEQKNEEGYFNDFGCYENAISYPLIRQELAIRTVYYELAAIIEHELQECAYPAWHASKKHKGPKTLFEVADSPERDRLCLRMISDWKFPEINKLIEEYYQIKIEQLLGKQNIAKIREIVNSFKHRKGIKDFRKTGSHKLKIGEQYRPTIEEAYDAIKQTHVFIKALWVALSNEKK